MMAAAVALLRFKSADSQTVRLLGRIGCKMRCLSALIFDDSGLVCSPSRRHSLTDFPSSHQARSTTRSGGRPARRRFRLLHWWIHPQISAEARENFLRSQRNHLVLAYQHLALRLRDAMLGELIFEDRGYDYILLYKEEQERGKHIFYEGLASWSHLEGDTYGVPNVFGVAPPLPEWHEAPLYRSWEQMPCHLVTVSAASHFPARGRAIRRLCVAVNQNRRPLDQHALEHSLASKAPRGHQSHQYCEKR